MPLAAPEGNAAFAQAPRIKKREHDMQTRPGNDEEAGFPHVSTGRLPTPERVTALVAEAHARYKSDTEGKNSQVYPALARVPSELFGVCVVGTGGNVYAVGDTDYEFSIMSVSKPFVFALVCQSIGAEQAREKLGLNGTGLPFNSLSAIERSVDGRTNPMVNAGAIATTSLVPGTTEAAKWQFIPDGLSRFAAQKLPLNEEVYASASETNFRNRHCPLAPQLQQNLQRPGSGDRPIHKTVLLERERQGPGGDGCDLG
jgi:glutaminase